jgi:hypothetical protein
MLQHPRRSSCYITWYVGPKLSRVQLDNNKCFFLNSGHRARLVLHIQNTTEFFLYKSMIVVPITRLIFKGLCHEIIGFLVFVQLSSFPSLPLFIINKIDICSNIHTSLSLVCSIIFILGHMWKGGGGQQESLLSCDTISLF